MAHAGIPNSVPKKEPNFWHDVSGAGVANAAAPEIQKKRPPVSIKHSAAFNAKYIVPMFPLLSPLQIFASIKIPESIQADAGAHKVRAQQLRKK